MYSRFIHVVAFISTLFLLIFLWHIHDIKLTILIISKYTVLWHCLFTLFCNHHHCPSPECVHHPKQNLCTHYVSPHCPLYPSLWWPLFHFPSPWVCLFEIPYKSKITQYLSICICVSPSMFSRFIHIPFYDWILFYCKYIHFVYPGINVFFYHSIIIEYL